MIKNITLNNFQGHKETNIELDPGFNVFIGKSDSGKSSIIRAIKWISTNRPSGDSFIRKGTKGMNVSMKIGEDVISRIKGKDNLYLINEEEYEGFGTNVPEEVVKLINFSDINIQYQMDSPFLLSETPGEISRFLNKKANLDEIDISLKNLTSMKRKEDQRVTILNSDVATLESQISKFKDIDTIEKIVVKGEKLVSELIKLKEDREKVNNQLDAIYALSLLIEDNKDLGLPIVIKAIKKSEEWQSLITKRSNLLTILRTSDEIIDLLKVNAEDIKSKDKVINAIEISNVIDQKAEKADSLEDLLHLIETLDDENKENLRALSFTKDKYNKLMPNECPLCGTHLVK